MAARSESRPAPLTAPLVDLRDLQPAHLDALLAEESARFGDKFNLRDFHDRFLSLGRMPIALIRYEMSGDGAEIADMWKTPPIPRAD